MKTKDFALIEAFLAVAREANFTRASAKIGMSQSALSHSVGKLETRLGVRLLARTTRSVALTDAGERLLRHIGPQLDGIHAELRAIAAANQGELSGSIRISSGEHAARTALWPKLRFFLASHPSVKVEVDTEQALTDIVAERFDAGIRFGDQVQKDMIAVRIGPDVRFAVVAAPKLLRGRRGPQSPRDLAEFVCINLRLPTFGGLYAWEFEKNGREKKVRVEGRLVMNNTGQIVQAALAGFGLAFVPEDMVLADIAKGRLVRVLRRLVPALYRLPPLLSQPPPAYPCLCRACPGSAPSRLTAGCSTA